MRIRAYISLFLLALLLPGGLRACALQAGSGSEVIQPDPGANKGQSNIEEVEFAGRSQLQHFSIQTLHLLSPANRPGSGGHVSGGHVCFILSGGLSSGAGFFLCSLRSHLGSRPEHFNYEQRLSLYPKHSFW